jgi:hypothetical protein
MKKVQVYLATHDGVPSDKFEAGLAAESQRICGLLPKGSHFRLSFRVPGDPLGQSAHGAEIVKSLPPFDAIIELSAGECDSYQQLFAAVDGLAGRLAAWVDAGRSIAIAGIEHQITPGSAPLFTVFPLRRLARLSHRECLDYWLDVHAEYGRNARVPPLKYRQFHGDLSASKAAALSAGVLIDDYDGVAMSYFMDIPELQDLLNQPNIAHAALEDEKRFIDHSRSVLAVCEISRDVAI